MTISIEKKSFRTFINPRSLDSYRITSIILLIGYTKTNRESQVKRYIYLDKLHFMFDLLLCDQEFKGLPKFMIPPWSIDKELKKLLIILVQNDIVEQSHSGNKVRYSLTEKGDLTLSKIEKIEELTSLIDRVKNLCKSVKTNEFEKSKVIYK